MDLPELTRSAEKWLNNNCISRVEVWNDVPDNYKELVDEIYDDYITLRPSKLAFLVGIAAFHEDSLGALGFFRDAYKAGFKIGVNFEKRYLAAKKEFFREGKLKEHYWAMPWYDNK